MAQAPIKTCGKPAKYELTTPSNWFILANEGTGMYRCAEHAGEFTTIADPGKYKCGWIYV